MSSACVDYVPALCTHRPSLLPIEWSGEFFGLWQRLRFSALMPREDTQTLSFRGRRSRNKVSVGEPAEGSLSFLHPHLAYFCRLFFSFRGRRESALADRGAPCFGRPPGPRRLTAARVHPPRSAFRRLLPYQENHTTPVGGYLGMSNDEERSEMRYVVRIAEFSESSNL